VRGKPTETIHDEERTPTLKLAAVLTSRMTAGAAEFLTVAARRKTAAKVLGSRTAGKTTVQDLFPLADESAIILSVGQWACASGETTAVQGISPDVPLLAGHVRPGQENDPVVAKALQVIGTH